MHSISLTETPHSRGALHHYVQKPETNSDESYYTCASWDKHSQGPLTCLRQYVRYQNQEFQLHAIYGLQPVPRDPKSNSESSQLPNAARPYDGFSCILETLLRPNYCCNSSARVLSA